MEITDRARKYMDALDPAISGQGGHDATFRAACVLAEGFGLHQDAVLDLLKQFNARCQPPWSDAELAHKAADACRRADPSRKGHLLRTGGGTAKDYRFGDRNGPSMPPPRVNLPAASKPAPAMPVRKYEGRRKLPPPMADPTRTYLKTLFKPEEGVCIDVAKLEADKDGKPREVPGRGTTLTVAQWLAKLDQYEGKVNKFLSSGDHCGIYVRVNPTQPGGEDRHVTSYRHVALEWDTLPLEEQWNIIYSSGIPCAAVVFSGGKSIHAIVRIEAKDKDEYRQRVNLLYSHFGKTPDTSMRNPSRYSRLPGCERFKSKQELVAVNIGAASWDEWMGQIENEVLGDPDTIDSLNAFDTLHDPNALIGMNAQGETSRWLCRGAACWLIGGSGIGKSSLAVQMAVNWALGIDIFGIRPVNPLRVLYIQAENDQGDMAEIGQGVLSYLDVDEWSDSERLDLLRKNLMFRTEKTKTDEEFVHWLAKIIERDKPDLVILDPFLSFAGIDVTKQAEVSRFLRTQLNPVLVNGNVALIMTHHSGKPMQDKSKSQAGWTVHDKSYLGIGSSELVNWARAAMILTPRVDGYFELLLAKRGNRALAMHPKDSLGNTNETTQTVYLRQGSGGAVRWIQIDPPAEQPRPEKPARSRKLEEKGLPPAGSFDFPGFYNSIKSEHFSLNKLAERVCIFSGIEYKTYRSAVYNRIIPILKERMKEVTDKGPNQNKWYLPT